MIEDMEKAIKQATEKEIQAQGIKKAIILTEFHTFTVTGESTRFLKSLSSSKSKSISTVLIRFIFDSGQEKETVFFKVQVTKKSVIEKLQKMKEEAVGKITIDPDRDLKEWQEQINEWLKIANNFLRYSKS